MDSAAVVGLQRIEDVACAARRHDREEFIGKCLNVTVADLGGTQGAKFGIAKTKTNGALLGANRVRLVALPTARPDLAGLLSSL